MNAQVKTTVTDFTGLQVQIISAQDAYDAAAAGKSVVARHIAHCSEECSFEQLRDVPATAFFEPENWQFGIKVEMVNINGHEFTKPLTLDEVAPGQEIYFVGATGKILKGNFVPENNDLIDAINNGSVQRDEHNARVQMHAIHDAFGIQNKVIEVIETDFASNDNEPKKPRRGRKPKEEKAAADESPVIDTLATAPIEDKGNPIFISTLINDIENATNLDELAEISLIINKNAKNFTNDELHAIQTKFSQHKECLSQLDLLPTSDDYQNKLNDLVTRAQNAKTIGEANELVNQTTTWSIEQRKPLLTAIHNRIGWLNKQAAQKSTDTPLPEPPSLMVQLQTAPNLDELERLKLEIDDKPLIIQAGLAQHYYKRRSELLKVGINDE